MALLTADQIAAADTTRYAEASIPEWGGEVRLRVMNIAERQKLAKYMQSEDDDAGFMTWVCQVLAHTAVDAEGMTLFADPAAAVEMLRAKPLFDATSLVETIVTLNKIGDGAIDDEEKKS